MSVERCDMILAILAENPCRSYTQVVQEIAERKKSISKRKGGNSEILAEFLLKTIPDMLRVRPYHDFIGDLDGDLVCEILGIEPVYVQVKSSDVEAQKFKGKIDRREQKLGFRPRVVAVSTESPFIDMINDFIVQVNSLEGRNVLREFKLASNRGKKRPGSTGRFDKNSLAEIDLN